MFFLGLALVVGVSVAEVRNGWVTPRNTGFKGPVVGGGKESKCDARTRQFIKNCDAEPDNTLLLEVDPSPLPPLPEQYHFLEDFRVEDQKCEIDRAVLNQGDCNSCWAFSLTRSLHYRLCRSLRTHGLANFEHDHINFSTVPLLCAIGGKNLCEPQAITDAIMYTMEHPLPSTFYASINSEVASHRDCEYLKKWEPTKVVRYMPGVAMWFVGPRGGRAVHGLAKFKRRLMAEGPIIIIMRQTKQFAEFSGSMFCPRDNLDFIDPLGLAMPASAPEDDWGNHFMTFVGFGKDATHGEYLLVQNSWDEIYEMGTLPADYTVGVTRKTSFVKICAAVAGKGKLEITSRPAYEPVNLVVYDSEDGKKKEGGSFDLSAPISPEERKKLVTLLTTSKVARELSKHTKEIDEIMKRPAHLRAPPSMSSTDAA